MPHEVRNSLLCRLAQPGHDPRPCVTRVVRVSGRAAGSPISIVNESIAVQLLSSDGAARSASNLSKYAIRGNKVLPRQGRDSDV
jgi:hypothetical protein